jgi:hypothetical protein
MSDPQFDGDPLVSEKTVSESKQAANRANAMHSTGPQTEDGKARSSRNAEQHGVYSKPVPVLKGAFADNPDEMDALLAGLREALLPRNALEDNCVVQIASALIKAQRLNKFAAHRIASVTSISSTIRALSAPDTTDEELAADMLANSSVFEQLARLEGQVSKELDRALVSFREARILTEAIYIGQLETRYAKRTQEHKDRTRQRLRLGPEFPEEQI